MRLPLLVKAAADATANRSERNNQGKLSFRSPR